MAVRGAELISKNIVKFTSGFVREVNRDMEQVREVVDKRVEKNISLSDHSLEDLAAMGHPYAVRAPQLIHEPGYQVHKQSGALLDSKFSGTDKASVTARQLRARAYVGVDALHAANVVYGTSKMVPRDFLVGSLGEVREQVWAALGRSLNKAVVNFNGERRQL